MRKGRLDFVTIDTEDVDPPSTRRPQVFGEFALQFAVLRSTLIDVDNVRAYSDRFQPSVVAPHVLAFSNWRERVPDERYGHLERVDGVHRFSPGDTCWLSWASRVASRYACPQPRS